MKPIRWYVRNEQQRKNLLTAISDQAIGDFGFLCSLETGKRTLPQNAGMYLYFRQLAEILNDAGLEIHMEYLGKSIDIPWTEALVKERIWLPVMLAHTGKKSTTKLDRKEVSEIYEIINRHFASTHGVMCSFPNRFGT